MNHYNPNPNNYNPYPYNPYPNNHNPNPNNYNPYPNNHNPYPTKIWFYIQNISTGLLLDIRHKGDGEVITYPCHGGDNQLFRYDMATGMIYSKLNGLALDINPKNDRVIIYHPHGGLNQKWTFDSDNTIRSHTGKVLDVAKKKRIFGEDTEKLIAYPKHGGPNQQFRVVYV